MSRVSLNQGIRRLIIGTLVVTVLSILLNTLLSTNEHARGQLDRDLDVGHKVLLQVLQNREHLLYNSADVLTADFGFKQAVATGERATIESALSNHSARIEADLMALFSLRGEIISSNRADVFSSGVLSNSVLINQVINEGGAIANMQLGDSLYQVVMLTVDAPAPVAIALIGFELDETLLNQLKQITQLEVTLSVFQDATQTLLISTLQDIDKERLLTEAHSSSSWLALLWPMKDEFVSRRFALDGDVAERIFVTLSENSSTLFSQFQTLLANIFIISLASIAVAMFFASVLSGRMTKPLSLLAKFSQSISSGNYEQSLDTSSNSIEFDSLSESLLTMQNNIREREQRISYQAQHDILTSLYNRYHFAELVEGRISSGEQFQVVAVNIYGFRGINDVFGYQNGDQCLRVLAQRIAEQHGMAARLSGGEILWIPNLQLSDDDVLKIKALLEKPILIEDLSVEMRVSIGILRCPLNAQSSEEMLKRCNIVLDEARKIESRILAYDDAMEKKYLRRLSIIAELRKVLAADQSELSLVYQPKLNLQTGELHGAEALLRWHSSVLGFVSPEEFIAVAESSGLIEEITHWVLAQAIKDSVCFRAKGIDLNIAINLSAADMVQPDIASTIASKMAAVGLPSSALSFEITEGDMVSDTEQAIRQLQLFKGSGLGVAIDDFGTGYSSMAYLQSFPVNALKIDKSFVLVLDSSPGDQKIVKTIIDLAHGFDMAVIAEGVETAAALQLLRAWNCELAQGYFISRPLPPEDFVNWISENAETDWLEVTQ